MAEPTVNSTKKCDQRTYYRTMMEWLCYTEGGESFRFTDPVTHPDTLSGVHRCWREKLMRGSQHVCLHDVATKPYTYVAYIVSLPLSVSDD